jgi:hypothetical protein
MTWSFRTKRSDRRASAALELTSRLRVMLDVDDDTAVSISEHDCGEPGCCGRRTVVLVLGSGQPTQTIKFEKPIESVTSVDLTAALASLSRACMQTQETAHAFDGLISPDCVSKPTESVPTLI